MTNDGNHGGGTDKEVKTVFFAYTKSGLPMLQNNDTRQILETHPSYTDFKQLDIASVASHLLQVPVPFSSVGIFHPLFHMEDLEHLPLKMLSNLK